jgi:hypothetical protein
MFIPVVSRLTTYKLAKTMTGEENYKITPEICTKLSTSFNCSRHHEIHLSFLDKFWDQIHCEISSRTKWRIHHAAMPGSLVGSAVPD